MEVTSRSAGAKSVEREEELRTSSGPVAALSPAALARLREVYAATPSPDNDTCHRLATELGVTQVRIQVSERISKISSTPTQPMNSVC